LARLQVTNDLYSYLFQSSAGDRLFMAALEQGKMLTVSIGRGFLW
jgi:hypothetical protein